METSGAGGEELARLTSVGLLCVECGTGNPSSNLYCGECGQQIVSRKDGVAPHPGFKGPQRLLMASSIVLAVSATLAAATFLLIQQSNPANVGLDFGGPLVNALLDAANVSSVRAPDSSSTGIAFLLVGTFLLTSLLAIASTVSGVFGGFWLLARWRDNEGPSRVGTAIAAAGDAGRRGLGDAHRLGAESLE